MRLICGFLHLDSRSADGARLDTMTAAMIEPGLTPCVARFVDGPVALACLDFAHDATRPPALPRGDRGLVLAADCRLDEPERLPTSAASTAGTGAERHAALLLNALEQWGPPRLDRVLGDYALAAWDPRSRTLTCARDGFGVRPCFFSHRPGALFGFASLPRGLHAAAIVERTLDAGYLLAELGHVAVGPERSLFHGVERVAPGGLLRVSVTGLARERHWQLDRAAIGRHACDPEEAAAELGARIGEAVRCRVPATGPVAAHLSGGLDSSALAILAARELRPQRRRLLGYSFMPSANITATEATERPYVEAVLRQEPDIVWTPIDIGDPAAFVLPRMDVDQLRPSDIADPDVQVIASAAACGATVLLSGWGGDEAATFNGRGALAEALLAGRWSYLARELRAATVHRGLSPAAVVRGELLPYFMPEAMQTAARALFRQPGATATFGIQPMIRADAPPAAVGVNLVIGSNTAANRWQLVTGASIPRRAEHWALAGARHGVAAAFPMLDRRVVEFALSLPGALFVRDSWKRRVFRDAMATVLPAAIHQRRDKIVPLPNVARVVAGQRDALARYVTELRQHAGATTLFDLDAVDRRVAALPTVPTVPGGANAADHQTLGLLRVMRGATYVRQHY